jgi:hypothetical protein
MLLDLWIAALKEEVGIAITTDNRGLMRQHLYKARADARNPELEAIVMLLPENENEIWLVHKDADDAGGPGADYKGNLKLIFP